MCTLIRQDYSSTSLDRRLGLLKKGQELREAAPTVAPHAYAQVIVAPKGQLTLTSMSFSLVPSWSKERKPKFATHNARLESAGVKPSFRDAFVKRHCLVPLSGFIEPIYEGELAGNMVEFHPPEGEILLAAGLWETWEDAAGKEPLRSFTVLTHDPIPYVAKQGHDRSPVLLKAEDAQEWLALSFKSPNEHLNWLLGAISEPLLAARVSRPLKAGWETR